MTILWSFDEKTGTYQLGNITPLEMGTLCATALAGFAITNGGDTYGAEAARRNAINYLDDLGSADGNRLLEVIIAADTHRIHAARKR